MYRVSPLTYLVDGIAATGMHARAVNCATSEFARFSPPSGQTCGQYLAGYLATSPGGQLINPDSMTECEYCPLSTSDQFLAGVAITWDTRWRNYGLGFAYIIFNIAAAVMLYYVFRVKKWDAASVKKGPSKVFHRLGQCGHGIRALFVGHTKPLPEQGGRDEVWPNRNRIY